MTSWLVIGGGISGLAAALAVLEQDPGAAVTVLEGSDRAGGKLRGARVAGCEVDVGAEAVLARRPEAVNLVREVGLAESIVHPTRAAAQVWSRGVVHPLPRRTLMGVPADPAALGGLLTAEEVARALDERAETLAAEDASIGDLVSDRLGRAVTERLVEPLLGGVYAGHADLISARAALPALLRAAQAGERLQDAAARALPAPSDGTQSQGSAPVFATVSGGLHRLPQAAAERIRAAGGQVRTGTLTRELRHHTDGGFEVVTGPRPGPTAYRADRVVLATPAAATARLLREVAPDAAGRLASVETASTAVLTFALDTAELGELSGSGVLVPPVEGRTIKAATFSATKWDWVRELGHGAGPGGSDLTLLRASVGRHREETALQRADEDLLATALDDLGGILGRRLPEPVDAHVQRWGGALPQYAVGHVDLVADVRASVAQVPGLAVCGATYDGVGVPACIASARRAVAQLHPAQ
ncbi:Protoporphyrinogen IX oxidase, aerobic, HemY [Serinicoccus hydrothermalis]|uniref:Coproporphyrinogen III oxidase n=1 Tax=Serinicoccus hydrothermalis TaxID=1758689 RepID=A0A1B1N919_9MICO|nr:protoporphyrinogen oxidase [Serinicoccus hydrothermalis]ANS77916.1 Protoporphyrinogen IX oxidase, aerobic, HemY [Serinicoccus hydrothermalis]